MNPKRRAALIDRLAESIGYIGPDFERFGGLFLEFVLGLPINNQGLNLVGYPVSGVIDSVGDDDRLVAEYSDIEDYFVGSMPKAESDLTKALHRKSTAEVVFLLSGRRRAPKNAQAFETRVRAWPTMVRKALHLWGAEEIAARLVDELLFDDRAVEQLARFVPEFERIHDEEAASHAVPAPDRQQLVRSDVDAEIARRLESSKCIAITGIGGLGKSAAAAAFAIKHREDFNLTIWLDPGEISRPEDLASVPLRRGGDLRNVAFLLKTRACLLVVDDAAPGISVDGLANLCGPKSRIIVTQRIASPGSFDLPFFSKTEARSMLEHAGPDYPEPVFDVVWNTAGGHALSLGLISAVVRNGVSWPDVALDCGSIGAFDDTRGQLLADRLLGRLRHSLGRELSVFAWSGSSVCPADFLESEIDPHGVRKLRGNCLTAFDRNDVIRLHDIVFASLDEGWCKPDRRARLDAVLETFLISAAAQPDLRLLTTARHLRRKLEELVRSGFRNPAFRYALLQAWDPADLVPELVGDPSADADAIDLPQPLAVMAVIEAIEQLFLHEKSESQAIATTKLRERLEIFDRLAALPKLSELERAQVTHHKAKALKRLGERDAAAELFETVLEGPVPMDEARLQLIDLYRGDHSKEQRSVTLVDEMLGRMATKRDVAYSVFLGIIERLPRGPARWRDDLIIRHSGAIERAITEAAYAGVQQALAAFSALGRYISTEHPSLFVKIFGQLSEPDLVSFQTDSERFYWAEILCEAARLPGADAGALRERALLLYEAEVRPQPFHIQRRAELLLDMGRAAEAEPLLRERPDDLDRSEWIQRLLARARLSQGFPDEALGWIDRALSRLAGEHFRAEFLELRFEIRRALGDEGAAEDLETAISTSLKDGEKSRLRAKLAE